MGQVARNPNHHDESTSNHHHQHHHDNVISIRLLVKKGQKNQRHCTRYGAPDEIRGIVPSTMPLRHRTLYNAPDEDREPEWILIKNYSKIRGIRAKTVRFPL